MHPLGTACKNREQILTNKTFKGLVAKRIRQIEKDLMALEGKAISEVKAYPELQERFTILQTIPGIGPITAMSLLILMPELGALSEKKVGVTAVTHKLLVTANALIRIGNQISSCPSWML